MVRFQVVPYVALCSIIVLYVEPYFVMWFIVICIYLMMFGPFPPSKKKSLTGCVAYHCIAHSKVKGWGLGPRMGFRSAPRQRDEKRKKTEKRDFFVKNHQVSTPPLFCTCHIHLFGFEGSLPTRKGRRGKGNATVDVQQFCQHQTHHRKNSGQPS